MSTYTRLQMHRLLLSEYVDEINLLLSPANSLLEHRHVGFIDGQLCCDFAPVKDHQPRNRNDCPSVLTRRLIED